MKKNRVIIFDFDGVIVDSCQTSFLINKEVMVDLKYEEWKSWADGNVYKSKIRETQAEQLIHIEYYFERFRERVKDLLPVKGMEDVFKKMVSMNFKLVIVSSSSEVAIGGFLEKYNLKKYFTEIMARETHNSKVEKFKLILKKYGIKAGETLMVTDSVGDVKEANEAKIRSIGVDWGIHESERLKKSGADFIAYEPKDILKGVEKMIKFTT